MYITGFDLFRSQYSFSAFVVPMFSIPCFEPPCALYPGTQVDLDVLRELAWSGVPPGLRSVCWRLLLGYLPPSMERRWVQGFETSMLRLYGASQPTIRVLVPAVRCYVPPFLERRWVYSYVHPIL